VTEEEIKLRTKFYLAPKSISLEQLKDMDKKYTSYPGLTFDQAKELFNKLPKRLG
jgi:hypothetical protein